MHAIYIYISIYVSLHTYVYIYSYALTCDMSSHICEDIPQACKLVGIIFAYQENPDRKAHANTSLYTYK